MTPIRMRGTFASAAAFGLLATLVAGCGELTGPISPTTPTGVTATLASATSATITWTPSPLNDGVISYSVFRNGAKVGESTTTTYTDTGLSPQTTYVYSIAANCKFGIVSDRSVENAASTVTTVDLTPPRVIANQPPADFVGVSPAATVTVTFSESMDPATINATTFTLRTAGGAAIAGNVTYVPTTRIATFTPTSSLPNPVRFTATVTTGVKDLAGNAMAAPYTFSFTTRDDSPPAVIATSPANGATGVSPTTAVTVTFSEAMDASTINGTNFTLRATGSGAAVGGVVTFNAATRVATFTPNVPLAQTTGYTGTIAAAVKDSVGNLMGVPFSFAFTTGDTNSPTVTAVVPVNGATNVALNTTVTVTFSEAMDPASITTTTFNLRNTATSAIVPATVAYNAASNSATLTPTAPLAGTTGYTVTVTTGARDAAGNALGSQFTSAFTTLNPDTTPPTVTSVLPANGATGVATNSTVQVTFSEPMDATTINGTNITLRNTVTSAAVAATVTYNATSNVATLTPSGPLSNATNYTLSVSTAVRDVAGNALASQFNSSFTTALAPDTTAPTIVARTPVNGATSVPANSNITVTFSEAMNTATINSTNITLSPTAGGGAVAAAVTCNSPCTVATLDPAADLASTTSYTITVTTGVTDVAGNALAANSTSTFTTADAGAPIVLSRTPPDGATNVAVASNIVVTFSEAMNPATINPANITVSPTAGGPAVAAAVTCNSPCTVATLDPTSNLASTTGYTITVTTGVTDVAGNALAANSTSTFTTADVAPPTVASRTPLDGATGVAVGSNITVTFSEAMNPATINPTNITVSPTAGGPAVGAAVTCNSPCTVATLDPTSNLASTTGYTITVTTGVTDVAGNALAANSTSTFTTADATAPTIIVRSPSDGATGIAVNSDATVTFSEPMDASTINTTNITLALTSGGPALAASVTYNAATNTATLNPTADLVNNTSYTLTVTTGVKDVAGNALAAASTSTFTTVPDTTPPTVISRTPTAATGVPVGTTVTFTFSENMNATTINGTTVTLNGGAPVVGPVTYDAGTRTATFTPSALLTANTLYTATVTTGATDSAGNPLTGTFSFTFTTAP